MTESRTVRNPTPRPPFVWRGSRFSMGIATHEDENGELVPCLQVHYNVRIPLRGSTAQEYTNHARQIASLLSEGLGDMPTIDELNVSIRRPLA